MKKGMTCIVLPTPDENEDKTWYERINLFELEFYVTNELGRLKNLKVIVYFDCCRVDYIAKSIEEKEEEVTAVDGFAGNLAFISACNKNEKVFVKKDGADSIAYKIARKWTISSKNGYATFSDFQKDFKIFIESQMVDQDSYVVLDPRN
jgi:hypothetical protein